MKKGQPQNTRGSKQRPSMKKEATAKHNGLKIKTFDEKRGNPKTHGAQNKDLWRKKGQQPTRKGIKIRRPIKPKIGNRQLTEASFAKLMLEGESDTFWFKLQSCTKATHQTKN
jgi:hypothetical protein